MNNNSTGAGAAQDTDEAGNGESAGEVLAAPEAAGAVEGVAPVNAILDAPAVVASTNGDADADGWLADETLFPNRPPISSHRRPRTPRKPVLAAAVVIIIGALGWIWIGGPGRSVPPALIAPPLSVVGAVNPAGTVDSSTAPGATASAGATAPTPAASTPAGPHSSPPAAAARSTAPVSRTSTAARPPAGTPVTGVRSTAPPAETIPPVTPKPTPTPTGAPVNDPAAGMIVRVVSAASHAWISVSGDSTSDGALIVTATAVTAGSRWRLVAGVGGCLQLINAHSGKALDNPGSDNDNGTQMQQWAWGTTNPNQTWCLHSVGNGRFSIQNDASRSLLYLPGGTAVQEWATDPASPTVNETWTMVLAS